VIIDLQVSPAILDWPEIRELAMRAESAGFGAFHVFDHLAGLPLGGTTMIECFSLLGALAQVTERIELGTMVANVWNRQVGTLVTAAASIGHLSGRRFHLGIGAGASPTSRWATEQHAVGAHLEPDVDARHRRVRDVIDLAAATWTPDRNEHLATFPLPSPKPLIIVGVNSTALSRLAGERADGINVQWNRPRLDAHLAAANAAAGDRPFLRTAYHVYDHGLFDPSHPTRVGMAERRIERLVLAAFGSPPDLPASV
jgi:alkanesulfonate monooxygenase SsuD/methylene tetrahydromethanopterin reductase-like flavin-dependent oxidoreductase (luciferase family)